MKNPKILVVDDSRPLLVMMKDFLAAENYRVKTASSAEEALSVIKKGDLDLVIMDIKMPGMSGLDALAEIKKIDPKLSVILMTAYWTTQTAIEAMKFGAYDYVTKPFNNREFKILIKKALETGRLMKESVAYRTKKTDEPAEGVCLVGNSPEILEIYKTIGKVADSNATVLIRGESGTGKELVARAIYQNSARADKPFLAINCAAIPESLLESELFGHEKGAFTGALNRRIGKFEQCRDGTIFLDEIGDMALSTQTKILRVLQEQTFEPVGSGKTVKVDVRVIASTNRDLWKAIEKSQFREDLYYRLKVVTIYMPPLRHRTEDFPLLVDYFIQKLNREYNKNIKKVSREVMEHLMKYNWPGNIRELENTIQAAVVMSKKDILLLDNFHPLVRLDSKNRKGFAGREQAPGQETDKPDDNYDDVFKDIFPVLKDSLDDDCTLYEGILGRFEKSLIKMVLTEVNRSQTKAAKLLGISRNTLRARMKKFGLLNADGHG